MVPPNVLEVGYTFNLTDGGTIKITAITVHLGLGTPRVMIGYDWKRADGDYGSDRHPLDAFLNLLQ